MNGDVLRYKRLKILTAEIAKFCRERRDKRIIRIFLVPLSYLSETSSS